ASRFCEQRRDYPGSTPPPEPGGLGLSGGRVRVGDDAAAEPAGLRPDRVPAAHPGRRVADRSLHDLPGAAPADPRHPRANRLLAGLRPGWRGGGDHGRDGIRYPACRQLGHRAVAGGDGGGDGDAENLPALRPRRSAMDGGHPGPRERSGLRGPGADGGRRPLQPPGAPDGDALPAPHPAGGPLPAIPGLIDLGDDGPHQGDGRAAVHAQGCPDRRGRGARRAARGRGHLGIEPRGAPDRPRAGQHGDAAGDRAGGEWPGEDRRGRRRPAGQRHPQSRRPRRRRGGPRPAARVGSRRRRQGRPRPHAGDPRGRNDLRDGPARRHQHRPADPRLRLPGRGGHAAARDEQLGQHAGGADTL
ncbi:MAG: L-lactate dehydrogenase, partial [uncultured Thermomicrobiales bacterium]